jgi:hypothetical protein
MEVQITIPDNLFGALATACGNDLARAALERLALDGYRTGNLTLFHVQELLSLEDRFLTQQWLGERGANTSYSLADLDADRLTLNSILTP